MSGFSGILEFLGVNVAVGVAHAILALFVLWLALRAFDARNGRPWKESITAIREDARASAVYFGLRWLGACLVIALCISGCTPATAEAARITNQYDRTIEASVAKYWPYGSDWHWWKAQLYQESLLDPKAVSPVGARGLAQFMPATWDQISREVGLSEFSPHMVKPSIKTGAYYMAKLAGQWSSKRPEIDRWDLARASYNAGLGNLLKAQKACGGALLYDAIITCLPEITGHHSKETITYNQRIHKWHAGLRQRSSRLASALPEKRPDPPLATDEPEEPRSWFQRLMDWW